MGPELSSSYWCGKHFIHRAIFRTWGLIISPSIPMIFSKVYPLRLYKYELTVHIVSKLLCILYTESEHYMHVYPDAYCFIIPSIPTFLKFKGCFTCMNYFMWKIMVQRFPTLFTVIVSNNCMLSDDKKWLKMESFYTFHKLLLSSSAYVVWCLLRNGLL